MVPSCRYLKADEMPNRTYAKNGPANNSIKADDDNDVEEVGEATRDVVNDIRAADLTGAPSTSGRQLPRSREAKISSTSNDDSDGKEVRDSMKGRRRREKEQREEK